MLHGIAKRIMAIALVVMMLVPMTAMAQDNAYGEFMLSDLVVNYMGTEFDFTGLSLGLFGAMDKESQTLLGGLNVVAGESDKTVVIELGADAIYAALGSQLVSLPYESLNQLAASSGAEMPEDFDIKTAIDSIWASLDSSSAMTEQLTAALEKAAEPFQALVNSKIEAAEVAEDTLTVGETEYPAQTIVITFTSEEIRDNLLAPMVELYTTGEVGQMLAPMFESLSAMAAQTDADVETNVADVYNAAMNSITEIKFPEGLTISETIAALEDGSYAMYTEVAKTPFDVADYAITMVESMGETIPEEDKAQIAAVANGAIELKMLYLAEGTPEFAAASYEELNPYSVSISENVYMAGSENPLVTMDMYLQPDGDKLPYGEINYAFDATSLSADSPKIDFTLVLNTTEDEGVTTETATLTINQNEELMGTVECVYAHDETSGSIDATIAQGAEEATPVLSITYAADAEGKYDFTLNAMGMVSVAGKVGFTFADFDTSTALAANGAAALDITQATEEDMSQFTSSLMGEGMEILGSIMQIPGVSQIMSMFGATEGGAEYSEYAPDTEVAG